MRALGRRGFTLVEVAVTIVILGIGLTLVMQALTLAKLREGHTMNYKRARDLGLLTLAQIEAGLFREDIRTSMSGSYADFDEPDFTWEVVLGDESFRDTDEDSVLYDPWRDTEPDEEEDEEATEPYEKVKVRVTFPTTTEFHNQLVLERWIPWEQVYGPPEDEEDLGGSER